MPLTPLRSSPDDAGKAGEPSDTERPPTMSGQSGVQGAMPGPDSFGPEPPSGVAQPQVEPTGKPKLTAAQGVGKLFSAQPSSAKLAAAPARSLPREDAGPPASERKVPVAPPARPARSPSAPNATMLHAGAPPARTATPPMGISPNTVPAPPPPPEPVAEALVAPGALTRRCSACNERYPADFLVCPRDATPLTDETGSDVDPLVGKLIGDTYQIVRVVGEGGMGRVYEARHLRLKERRFAVKTLHADLARNSEMAARFLREAESASSIAHPNVIDVFDVHHLPDGVPYFVGEFLEGEELAGYVERHGPLDARMAALIGRQICSALGAAHARGIIHRDMKPENVFVLQSSIEALAVKASKSLVVKILDFGISTAGGEERSHLTRTGVIMGTPSYMSPEQARGRQVDHRADVYSVGAVIYYAITGRRPFDSEDPTSTISMVLTQDPVRPRQIDPRIPEALELVVQRAMAKDAQDRYQTMAELERALGLLNDTRTSFPVPASSSSALAPVSAEQALSVTAAGRAFDMAKQMIGGGAMAAASAKDAKLARPTIAATSAALGTWFVGGTTCALAGLVRVLHDGEITLTECVLLVVGCLFAAATPIALYVMHVRKVIWPNSVRAVQLANDLKRTTSAALVTYGALSIGSRIAYTVFARNTKGMTSGFWDITLFLLSLVAAATVGGAAPLLRNMRRRKHSG